MRSKSARYMWECTICGLSQILAPEDNPADFAGTRHLKTHRRGTAEKTPLLVMYAVQINQKGD